MQKKEPHIRIIPNGPYLVSGNIPLSEKIIVPNGDGYIYQDGRKLPQRETYALCRCGKTSTPPFCDGAHIACGFVGEETACKNDYDKRATKLTGSGVDLLDDGRCAFARFCHRESGDAWELAENSDTEFLRSEAILAASECPAGRLTALEKDGTAYEPEYSPGIEIFQDPEEKVSAGIFVKGGIPIESADGSTYEVRNRVVLCRCGLSHNKPFCDAAHIAGDYHDLAKRKD
ncbi:MAG: CDGSH iron-sulfur domain-containing protein [Eubacteriales bacterium]|nr:CDGSH iron-sulfur domain-containing protein [Eubacteriales bacterium]